MNLQPIFRCLVATGLLLIAAIFLIACSSDSVSSEADTDIASDVAVDSGSDVETHDGDPGSDTELNGELGNEDTGPDSEIPQPVEDDVGNLWTDCDCAHPDDKCSPRYCGRPGIKCGPEGEECPEGYRCITGDLFADFCVCDGDEFECGPYCDDLYDCKYTGHTCDRENGICRDRTGCLNQMHCPEGQVCHGGTPGHVAHNHCYETGDAEEGEDCVDNRDCQSGICYCGSDFTCSEATCVEQCLGDEDCDDGEGCRKWANMNDLVSSPGGCQEVPECTVSCPGHKRCLGDDCQPRFCRTSADCDGADCMFFSPIHPGTCEEHPDNDEGFACKPDEYIDSSHEYCILPIPCWEDEDCGEPYECATRCRRPADDGGGS